MRRIGGWRSCILRRMWLGSGGRCSKPSVFSPRRRFSTSAAAPDSSSTIGSAGLARQEPCRGLTLTKQRLSWHARVQALADSGDYVFSLNRHLFVGEKPSA
jgi:hypothetical protein